MNTKQLWQALTNNTSTNEKFGGIFSYDTLKGINKRPQLIICNTDPSDKEGTHWILFFFHNEGMAEFYDSLGNDITFYGPKFLSFIEKYSTNYYQSLIRTQPLESDLCGYYCLYYALKRCHGYNMEHILNSMSSPQAVVKTVQKNFSYCDTSNCPLLQSCKKC